jgi:pimeloyl-ACP methyl ester carboxylesterase
MTRPIYTPKRVSHSEFIRVRTLEVHLRIWDADAGASSTGSANAAERTVFLLHGWMDVGASFQFLVDCLPRHWKIIAPDWRGYGLTRCAPVDNYFFPDYMGDLDALLERLQPALPVDLVAHSMGGNVAMLYAGVRPERVRRLVNLEGLGMSAFDGAQAPKRYAKWLAELRSPPTLRDYADLDAVADRLLKNNPRLRPDYAQWLAQHWSRQNAQGRYELQADPAHKIINANLYRVDEVVACWKNIAAPVLLVMSDHLEPWADFAKTEEFSQRLANIRTLHRVVVTGSGHMLHHDQPEALASHIGRFIDQP